MFEDEVIPYLKDASAAVHQHGAKIFSQITHRGRRGNSDISWHPLFAPSGLPERVHRETPHAMEIEEVQDVVRGLWQGRWSVEGRVVLTGWRS